MTLLLLVVSSRWEKRKRWIAPPAPTAEDSRMSYKPDIPQAASEAKDNAH